MTDLALKVALERDGRLLHLTLNRPKANIIDAEMIAHLQDALDAHLQRPELAAVLIDAEGPNFSFGASVEEHLPDQCAQMLKHLHHLILSLVESPVPVIAAVSGFCLGGGLELACSANLLFAAPNASFGQPEIQLGVFAPAASCLLPERIGRAQAEDLLLSGRSMTAEEAWRIGLINQVDEQPQAAALAWIEKYIEPRSSFSLRQAVKAARHDVVARMRNKLAIVENQYLEELMAGHDPVEGMTAFLEKRSANWENQ